MNPIYTELLKNIRELVTKNLGTLTTDDNITRGLIGSICEVITQQTID